MVLIGIWHGFFAGYAIWGAWHGVGLFLHREWARRRPSPAGPGPLRLARRDFRDVPVRDDRVGVLLRHERSGVIVGPSETAGPLSRRGPYIERYGTGPTGRRARRTLRHA